MFFDQGEEAGEVPSEFEDENIPVESNGKMVDLEELHMTYPVVPTSAGVQISISKEIEFPEDQYLS